MDSLRLLLCDLQNTILQAILDARSGNQDFARIVEVTQADAIFHIDKVTEEAIIKWFTHKWPSAEPVQVVMEGIEDDHPLTFPQGTLVSKTVWKAILDPIDGTRNIMYDKRSAWSLAGIAPQKGPSTCLSDIVVAAMTELPPSKQADSDQVSAVKGQGLIATRHDLRSGQIRPIHFSPSKATDFKQGFASIARFFPAGLGLLAAFEEALWDSLFPDRDPAVPLSFQDQYISTGGQIYELLCGHDRMIADLRPLAFAKLGLPRSLVCHPYDMATALLLVEAGGVLVSPEGGPVIAPLDTTSPVAWIGFANPHLAAQAMPHFHRLIPHYFH